MSGVVETAIVGGGIVGLSLAYVLAREGVPCTVFDRGPMGREASWAGAGLIPPIVERVDTSPLNSLRSWSALLYPEWSAAIRELTGLDNGFRRCGGVDVAATEAEELELKTAVGRWKREKVVYEKMPPGDYVRVEPSLNPELRAVYYLPDRAQIRNPRHLRALETAARALGADLRPDEPVLDCVITSGRMTRIITSKSEYKCGKVVVAAGAWSGGLFDRMGLRVPTPPLKGQIVLLNPGRPLLRRIVEHGKNYLVPRDDGRILIGATEEEVGFDSRTTEEGFRYLMDEAILLCPRLKDVPVETTWAGLRPGSIDTRPYVGFVPGVDNLIAATGHKRAGLQLAPATAEVVADLVMGRPPRIDLSAFAPTREASVEEDAGFRS